MNSEICALGAMRDAAGLLQPNTPYLLEAMRAERRAMMSIATNCCRSCGGGGGTAERAT